MTRAAIIGATGYAGAELVRILSGHPDVELTAVTSRHGADLLSADTNLVQTTIKKNSYQIQPLTSRRFKGFGW